MVAAPEAAVGRARLLLRRRLHARRAHASMFDTCSCSVFDTRLCVVPHQVTAFLDDISDEARATVMREFNTLSVVYMQVRGRA